MIDFNVRAFNPLMDVTVAYTATRGSATYRGSFKAADMGEDFIDPLAQPDAATQVRTRTFVIESSGADGWDLDTFPQIGDRLTLATGPTYAVTEVHDFAGSYSLKCKEAN